jgi:hypothetical protein
MSKKKKQVSTLPVWSNSVLVLFFFFKVIPKKNALTTTKNCPGGLLAVTVTAGDSNKLIVAG